MNEAFAAVLGRNRDKLNTKFAYARHAYPALDGEALKEHLLLLVAPVVEAVHQHAPQRSEEVALALYDISLDLVGKTLFGAETRYPALLRGWQQLFHQLPQLLTEDPLRFSGAVMNALFNLSVAHNTRPTFWIDEMLRLGRQCDELDSFLDVGKVVAWRAGMAHFRDGALDACLRLAPALAREALALADYEDAALLEEVGELVARLRPDPWLAPWVASQVASQGERRDLAIQRELKVVATVGAFRGFGGVFTSQPEVVAADGDFYVYDNENCWLMTADLFGATLHRMGATLPELTAAAPTDYQMDKAGKVSKGSQRASFPHLAEPTSVAANDTTLAVTLRHSFGVYLIAAA